MVEPATTNLVDGAGSGSTHVARSREYSSFLGTAGETHAASFIALRGYVVSLPLTDVGEDLFATDPATSTVRRVQVKTARRTQPGAGGTGTAADVEDDDFEESTPEVEEQPDVVSAEHGPAKPRGRPRNEKEQALFNVTIKRAQLDVDDASLTFVLNLVDARRFRSFVITQVKLRAILSKDRSVFKKTSSKSKGVTLSVDADNIAGGEVRVGGTGKNATALTDFEGESAWDVAFPPTSICTKAGG